MTIQEHIEAFINQNESVQKFLNSIQDFENEDVLIPAFCNFLVETKYNAALGINFLMSLQLLNDPKNHDQFDLTDLRKLFDSLLSLQPYELNMYVEAAHFEWAIMDDEVKAKEMIDSGIEKAKAKIEELEKIRAEINQ